MGGNWVFWLENLGREKSDLVGRKCANLGEMMKMGFNVPYGFALSTETYKDFMNMTGAAEDINECISTSRNNRKDPGQFIELSAKISKIVQSKEMPGEMTHTILTFYKELCRRCKAFPLAVSVRSAGPVSRPGQYETYLNVSGEHEIINNIKKVWASTFNSRSLAFRSQKALPLDSDPIGVAVLRMVRARAAGVVFTADPNTGDDSRISVEANWGIGESVVSGMATPDIFILDKKTLEIQEKSLGPKPKCILLGESGVIEIETPPEKSSTFCLSDEEVKAIAQMARKLEDYFGVPQDVEWAIDQDAVSPGNVVLLQARAEVIAGNKTQLDQIVDLMLDRFSNGITFGGGNI